MRRDCVGRLTVVALAFLVWMPTRAFAQDGGGIAGVVKDTTGAVVPGVSVEASSPALIEQVRAVVTDEQGQYKLVNLRPGEYVVTFTLSGFNIVKRDGITLTTGFTATVNAEMAVGAVQETVTVSSASPVVDIQNVRQQRVMTREVLEALPIGRTIQSVGTLIPGLRLNSTSGATIQDVGGMAGEQGTFVIHGSRANDMLLLLNGMPYNSARGTFTSNIRADLGEVQEVSYQVGANSAEYLSGGVVMNLIPKEGGNRVSGSSFANFANKSLQSNNLTDDLRASGLTAVNGLDHIWDMNLSAGGPLRKNKLWLFGSFRYWGVDSLLAGNFHDSNLLDFLYTPDLTRQAHDPFWTLNESLRVTWQMTPKQKVGVFFVNQPRESFGGGSALAISGTVLRTPEGLPYQKIPGNMYGQINWTAPLTSRLLVEAGVGFYKEDIFNVPASPEVTSDMWPIVDVGTNIGYGAPYQLQAAISRLRTYRTAVSYVTGSHASKFGVIFQDGSTGPDRREIYHDTNLTLLNGAPSSITLNTTPFGTIAKVNAKLELFAQDQWTVKRMTFNAGIRFDYLNGSVPAQQVPAARFVGARDFAEVRDVPNWTDLSPRLGVSYDLFGTGKTALKATLSRYLGSELTALARLNDPLNTSVNTATRTWTDLNGNFIPECDFLDPNANAECGRLSNLNFGKPSITTVYDLAVLNGFGVRPVNWETSFGVQHELVPQVALNASYFRRSYSNFTVADNQDVTPTDYDPYCITAPLDPRLPGGGGQRMCGLYDISLLKFNQIHNLVTFAKTYGTQTEIYDGVDLTINGRFPHGVLLQGGLNVGRTRTNRCFVVDSPQVPFCDVRPPFEAQVKLLGTYGLPWDIQLAGTFQRLPGPQITATYIARNAEIAPSLGRNLSSGGNGTAPVELIAPGTLYGDSWSQVDARVSRSFRVAKRRIEGMVDLYNLFNASPVIQLNTTYGMAWQRPSFVLPGRLVKFGVQVHF